MKTNKMKKGFTIVELVIVVAVIGILSAVLIPTFVNLTKKASETADEALVKNLNTQLRLKEQTEGKNPNLTEALKDAKEGGYLIENLTPRGSKDIVWNQDKDEFSLSEGAPGTNAHKFWKIYEKAADLPATQTYSIYAKGTDWTSVPTLTVGFDAGENENIPALTFETTAAIEVIIRTNATKTVLTVNAANATIHHYDCLDALTITAVAGESYHEHGQVKGKATISQGHIAIESGASVPQVSVEDASGSVKVTANESTVITVDTTSASSTSVVTNSNDVFVDGVDASAISGTKASAAVLPTEIDTEAKLKAVMDNGGLGKLTADIVLTQKNFDYVRSETAGGNAEQAMVATNKEVALNLNGHKITVDDALADDMNLFAVDSKGKLKIYDEGTTKGRIVGNSKLFFVRGEVEVLSGEFVSTVLTAGTDFRSMFILDVNAKLNILDGKFITPKCVMTSWGSVAINGGEFVCASASTGWSTLKGQSSYAYTIRLMGGKNTVANAKFYGIHGAVSCEGGESVFDNVYAEASEDTLAKFSAYAVANNIQIHVLDNKASAFLVDEAFVTANKSQFKSSVHYGLYSAGEYNIVYATVNSGTFISSDKYAAYIGNKNDGGLGLYSHATINGGKFVAPAGKAAVYETGITISYGAGYTEIFGGNFTTDVTPLMKDTLNYRCVEQADHTWTVSKR